MGSRFRLKKTNFWWKVAIAFWVMLSYGMAQNAKVIVGEGIAPIVNNDVQQALEVAKKYAMSDLASQIEIRVHSDFLNSIKESSSGIDEYTRSNINLITDLKIDGVSFQVIKKSGYVHVKALLDKEMGRTFYLAKCRNLQGEIDQSLDNAHRFLQDGKRQTALSQLLKALRNMNEWEQAQLIYFAVGGSLDSIKRPTVTHAEMDREIARLLNGKVHSFNDALTILAIRLVRQIDGNPTIRVSPFRYEDNDFGSAFSAYLSKELENLLVRHLAQKSTKVSLPKELRITGTYWIRPGTMVILAQIRDEQGSACGSARVEVPLKYITSLGIAYVPQNFAQAVEDQNWLDASQLVYGNLKLFVWTNRGSDDLLFRQGEKMKIFVRSNAPAYIRCIYHLANGMRTPLLENFHIDATMVHKTIEISRGFDLICAPPFGVERLQIFASTEKFPPLKTRHVVLNGQKYEVLAQNFQNFVLQTRGFIKHPQKTPEAESAKYAERVITVTTIPAH